MSSTTASTKSTMPSLARSPGRLPRPGRSTASTSPSRYGSNGSQHSLPSPPPCTSTIAMSCSRPSGEHAADLEVDDRVPVDPEVAEDLVAVLVELGCALRHRRFLAELHRRRGEAERRPARGLTLLDVAVRDRLRIGCRF